MVYTADMKEATLIYPHQLFEASPAVADGRPIYLVEEPLLLTYNPIHRQKLMLHKLSMDVYQEELSMAGHAVTRLTIQDHPETTDIFDRLQSDGVRVIHVVDTTDNFLEAAIAESGLERINYESPLFILEKDDAIERYKKSKKHLAAFYKQLRLAKKILLEKDGSPVGGKWSFDAENRKKLPKNIALPDDIEFIESTAVSEATAWIETVAAEQYGEAGAWIPYTRANAKAYLKEFLTYRFKEFGPYEDAITPNHTRLWHSTLSPLLNIGLLSPDEILREALKFAKKNDVPINSVEGFVRQILGWREFIRASYEADGSLMRSQNFWQHTRELPESFWTGTTYILPVDHVIHSTLQVGYAHHIERLMILGNFMLLSEIKPDDVYRWFMAMYVDAYDWAMVPNVYGMSQFADGGSFATKPYISGSNYLKRMSDFKGGAWEETWTALYWNFIESHLDFFKSNHRLSMMPRMLEKMDPEKRLHYQNTAKKYLG